MKAAPRRADDLDALRAALVQLTPAQADAVDALATGSTHDSAAAAAGVTRETVTRWSNYHPGFRAALDGYRRVLATEQFDAARRLRDKALAVVEQALDTNDLTAALAVLRAVPAPELGPPLDPHGELADQVGRRAANVPPPPAPRLADGSVDFLAQVVNGQTLAADHAERAQRIATERLSAAAGVHVDLTGDGP